MSGSIDYRLRVFDPGSWTTQAGPGSFTVTGLRGGANAFMVDEEPHGDGASFGPLTGDSMLGAYTGRIADASIGSSLRIVTSELENPTTFQQQLGYRNAILDYQINGGGYAGNVLIAGILTLLRLVDGIQYEYTISDPMRAQYTGQVFSPAPGSAMTAFLAAWPKRGCIFGGPISGGGALNVPDDGGWQMRVQTTSDPHQYILRPLNVYGPPEWFMNGNMADIAPAINQAIQPLQALPANGRPDLWTSVQDCLSNAWAWPGMTVLINGDPWKPLDYYGSNQALAVSVDASGIASVSLQLLSGQNGDTGLKVISDGVRTLANNQIVRVRCLTILPSDVSPVYIEMHPIDALVAAWTAVGLAFSADACFGVGGTSGAPTGGMKVLFGTEAVIALRITTQKTTAELVAEICLPWGIGIRGDGSGQLTPFDARLDKATNDVSTLVTINDSDVVDGSTTPYELDPAQGLQSATFQEKQFFVQFSAPVGASASAVDGVTASDISLTLVNPDATGLPGGTFQMSVPDGAAQFTKAKYASFPARCNTIATSLFTRFGHGGVTCETTFVRGGAGGTHSDDGPQLGDEVLVNLKQLPNRHYRLGDNNTIAARAMQIIRRTVTAKGFAVKLQDSGPNAQPLAVVPALSIAASATQPRTVALLTITNASVLNGLGYGARLQWAFTAGGAPSAAQYTDVWAWSAGQVPTTAIALPPAQAGTTLYVQARSEGVSAARPSNYTSPVNLTLSSISDPSGIAVTPSIVDASQAGMSWVQGAGTAAAGDVTDVWLRLSGTTFDTAVKVATLNAGSTFFTLQNLLVSTAYIVSVQHRDPHTQEASDPVDEAFTSGSTVRTLQAPITPFGFSGALDPVNGQPLPDGTFGIAVIATEVPGLVEVDIATETGVGTGSYGAFAMAATLIPSSATGWTKATFVAPNDGLRRQLKARHVLIGSATASGFCAIVTVLPWLPLALPPVGSVGSVQGTGSVDADGVMGFSMDIGMNYQSFMYELALGTGVAYPSDAAVIAGGTTVNGNGIQELPAVATAAFGQTGSLSVIPWTGPNGTGTRGPSFHLQASYLTFTSTTKTVSLFPVWVLDVGSVAPFVVDSANMLSLKSTGVVGTVKANAQVYLPDGVIVTAIAADMYFDAVSGAGGADVELQFYRNSTLLGDITVAAGSGWVMPTPMTLSETMSSGNSYFLSMDIVPSAGGFATDVLGMGAVIFTYTMPNPKAAL